MNLDSWVLIYFVIVPVLQEQAVFRWILINDLIFLTWTCLFPSLIFNSRFFYCIKKAMSLNQRHWGFLMKSIFESKVFCFLKFCRACLPNCIYSGKMREAVNSGTESKSLWDESQQECTLALAIWLMSVYGHRDTFWPTAYFGFEWTVKITPL